MLMIIAHHYVVNSGLTKIYDYSDVTGNMVFLQLFGWGGKTGINCFLLITGYFMCKSRFTWRKWLKLVVELKFYVLTIYGIFLLTGYQEFELSMMYHKVFSISCEFGKGFGGTFVCLFLLVPYMNKLIGVLSQKEYTNLLLLLLGIQTIVSTFVYNKYFEYLSWYVTAYFIGAYIRLYLPSKFKEHKFAKRCMFSSIIMAMISILVIIYLSSVLGKKLNTYYFVSDSNKILSIASAVFMFLYFISLKIRPNKLINTIAKATFGILLIHTSGDTMRHFLWNDLFNNVSFYDSPFLICHALLTVFIVYCVCAIIDLVRIKFLESPFFSWIDKKKILDNN